MWETVFYKLTFLKSGGLHFLKVFYPQNLLDITSSRVTSPHVTSLAVTVPPITLWTVGSLWSSDLTLQCASITAERYDVMFWRQSTASTCIHDALVMELLMSQKYAPVATFVNHGLYISKCLSIQVELQNGSCDFFHGHLKVMVKVKCQTLIITV